VVAVGGHAVAYAWEIIHNAASARQWAYLEHSHASCTPLSKYIDVVVLLGECAWRPSLINRYGRVGPSEKEKPHHLIMTIMSSIVQGRGSNVISIV
jgi:hypothetical protein